MAWSICESCGASYKSDESLTACPRCQRPLKPPVEQPPAQQQDVNAASPSAGEAPKVNVPPPVRKGPLAFVLPLLLHFGVATLGAVVGVLLWYDKPLRPEVIARNDWLAWPAVGLAGGVVLGLIIGLLAWFGSPGNRKPKHNSIVVSAFTPQSLASFLTQMGYEFKTVNSVSGEPYYTITLVRDGWTIYIDASVSQNRVSLWLSSTLRQVPTPAEQYGDQLLRLLQASWDNAPVFFGCLKNGNHLTIQRAMENRDVTAVRFRLVFDELVGALQRSLALWDVTKWPEKNIVLPPTDRRGASPGSDRFASPSN